MPTEITSDIIIAFKDRLESHPVYDAITSLDELQCFMEHHVYSVWDFMSLIKYLQSRVAPAHFPWIPQGDGDVRRFINELVLEEESDATPDEGVFSSHFELYLNAMNEIGANTSAITNFIASIQAESLQHALNLDCIPEPSGKFTTTSFQFIDTDKPHVVAAALALGREHIIPGMFRSILKKIGVTEAHAPIFHFYLNRHIHLDEDFHAPLSLKLLNHFCHNEQQKIDEAIAAANNAIDARLQFWDGVLEAIKTVKN